MKRENSAFSIIELGIFLTIAASLLMGYIALTSNPSKDYASKAFSTKETMDKIASAIESFRIINKRLPCPADITIPADSLIDGIVFDDENIIIDNGTRKCRNNVGSVPTRSLGLSASNMLDGWGRRIKYHVSDSLCSNTECTEKTYQENIGNLTITNENGTITNSGAYVLVSHGLNGLGAFLPSGLQAQNQLLNWNDAGSNLDEKENANNNTTYRAFKLTEDFDDLVFFRTKNQIEQLQIDTETRIISAETCADNSAKLATININQTVTAPGTLRKELQDTEKSNGSITYNFGDEAVIKLMLTLQEVCKIYDPSLQQTCPGGATYNTSTNACECADRSWDGTCN